MPTDTELQLQEKIAVTPPPAAVDNTSLMVVEPVGIEKTSEFQKWLTEKCEEVRRYLKLSFNNELPAEKLVFHAMHLGYPDPVGQLRTHARIWGYNYKVRNEKTGELENVTNPANGQLMSYVVWQKLDPPVMPIEVTNPALESDADLNSEDFEPEPVLAT